MPRPVPSAMFGPAERLDAPGARQQPVGEALQQGDTLAEPWPGLGQADQRRGEQHAVDRDQNPGAPRHRRARLERQEDAPDIELVREVEEEGAHAQVDQHERQQRRVQREVGPGVVAARRPQHREAPQDHHSGDQAAGKEIDGDLPAPYGKAGVDQRIVAGGGDFEHCHRLTSDRRPAAGCRLRAAACGTCASAGAR